MYWGRLVKIDTALYPISTLRNLPVASKNISMPLNPVNYGSYRRQKLLVGKNCLRISTIPTCYRRKRTSVSANYVPNTHFQPWRPPPSNGHLGFSSFNDAALLDGMLDNVSMPRSRGWGTMVAVVHSFPISDAMVHVNSHARRDIYCTFDLNWQPGPWKARISISPQ